MFKFQIFPCNIHGENPKNPLSELCEKENRANLTRTDEEIKYMYIWISNGYYYKIRGGGDRRDESYVRGRGDGRGCDRL